MAPSRGCTRGATLLPAAILGCSCLHAAAPFTRLWSSPSRGVSRRGTTALTAFSGHPLVQEVLTHFRPPRAGEARGATLLDVGCAEGGLTRSLAGLPGVSRVVGLDVQADLISEAQEATARARAAGAAPPVRVDFTQGSATDPGLFRNLSETARYITCFTTLHWLKEPQWAKELAIVNFARSLECGGQMFLVHFLGLDDTFMQLEADVVRRFAGSAIADAEVEYTSSFSMLPAEKRCAQFQGLFKAACLTIEDAHIAYDSFPIERSQFLPFLRSASVQLQRLPQDKHQAYLQEWMDEIQRQGKATQQGNSLEFQTVALLAVLRKDVSVPGRFYDQLLFKCDEGVLRLEHLERFGQQ